MAVWAMRSVLAVGAASYRQDDIYIVGESKEYLKSLISPIRTFLKDRLRLELCEEKTHLVAARHGVEFLGAFVKPFRTYVAARTLRRIRKQLSLMRKRTTGNHMQSVVNSLLGTLSHYESYALRKVMLARTTLPELGRLSSDGLRFYPDGEEWWR